MQLTLHGVQDGLKVSADLNWGKKDGAFGGSNTWGGPAQDVKGPGPYTFNYTPQDKPDLGNFIVTVFVSPAGDFADHTLLATASVPVGDAQGKTLKVDLGAEATDQTRPITAADMSSPQVYTSDFLIEVYFKTDPGQKDAALVQKMSDSAGYGLSVNAAGGVSLAARASGGTAGLDSHATVNDGQWHHVIAEADRQAGTFTIYVDGKQDATGKGLGPDASLANEADLYVGGTPQGHDLAGAIDFLRIARGTLADSKTTIDELYAWEFNGPFLYDFTGRKRPSDGGCAGAIDAASE